MLSSSSGVSPSAAASRAEALRRQGRYAEAAREFELLSSRDADNLFALSRGASARLSLAAREQARHTKNALDLTVLEARYRPIIAVFDCVLREAPEDLWTRCQRVEALRCMKLHRECVAECERVAERRPDFAWVYQRKAWAHRWLLEYDAALGCIEQALSLAPAEGASRAYRGLLFGMTQNIEAAEAEFVWLTQAEPALAAGWTLERGILLLFNGRVRAAIPHLLASLERSDAYLAHYYLAVADGDGASALCKQADAHAQRLLGTEAASLGAYMLAGLAALRGDRETATEELGRVLHGNDVILEAAVCDPATRSSVFEPPLRALVRAALATRPLAHKYLWPNIEKEKP